MTFDKRLLLAFFTLLLSVCNLNCLAMRGRIVTYGEATQSLIVGTPELQEVEASKLRVVNRTWNDGTFEGVLAHVAICHARRTDTNVTLQPKQVTWTKPVDEGPFKHNVAMPPWAIIGSEFALVAVAGGTGAIGLSGAINSPTVTHEQQHTAGIVLLGTGAVWALGAIADIIYVAVSGDDYTIERTETKISGDLGEGPCKIVPVANHVGEVTIAGVSHHILTDANGRFQIADLPRSTRAYLDISGEQVWFLTAN